MTYRALRAAPRSPPRNQHFFDVARGRRSVVQEKPEVRLDQITIGERLGQLIQHAISTVGKHAENLDLGPDYYILTLPFVKASM